MPGLPAGPSPWRREKAHARGSGLRINYVTQKRMSAALPPLLLSQSRPRGEAVPAASGRDFRPIRIRTSFREQMLVGPRPRELERCAGAAPPGRAGRESDVAGGTSVPCPSRDAPALAPSPGRSVAQCPRPWDRRPRASCLPGATGTASSPGPPHPRFVAKAREGGGLGLESI